MSLVIYNTMTRQKEPYIPVEEGKSKMYVCGPTVYDHSHIGHARAAIIFDVLYRHLLDLGHEVSYVRNFTDVDDKIINRANEKGVGYQELAQTFIDSYHEDMDALAVLRPTLEPKATEHIEEMIEDVKSLIITGYAYQVDGDVYYDVSRFPAYGRLSGRNIEDMQAGARIEVDERKRNPLDFALWKQSKPGEPSWPSPWGDGRPGWHIECSSMSKNYLGPEFDIHGGGLDLIFPHHENELAQSKGLGRNFARYWMHNGFVRVDNQKMSKSLDNFFTIKEILAQFDPEVVRMFLLSKHYRSPIDFSEEGLFEVGRGLDRSYRSLQAAAELVAGAETETTEVNPEIKSRFREAMNDDLNTAKALGHIFEAVKELNRLLDEARAGRADLPLINSWVAAIKDMGGVLGILNRDPLTWKGPSNLGGDRQSDGFQDKIGLSAEEIEEMIVKRQEARSQKNWAEADRIRDELKSRGIVLEDAGGQTKWRIEV